MMFDEGQAMQNAAGNEGERGEQALSLHGRRGLTISPAVPI
jgi:hypothetical protein